MSWSELERLVESAETQASLRRALSHCRSGEELLLAGQRLGFAIEQRDLQLARRLHAQQGAEPEAVASRPWRQTRTMGAERCG